MRVCMEMYWKDRVLLGFLGNKEACWSTFVFLAVIYMYGYR